MTEIKMAVTVRDLKDALSANSTSLWLLDENGRSWLLRDNAYGVIIDFDLQGFQDDYYVVGINKGGDLQISASEDISGEFRLENIGNFEEGYVLSGKIVNTESCYRRYS